jgi:small GTP-binding protein
MIGNGVDQDAEGGLESRQPVEPEGGPAGSAAPADPNPPRSEIETNSVSRRFHVVVIGAGPVGKTALINALLGRTVGQTGATIGTTQHGMMHTYSVEGLDGTLLLTDTPGLSESGPEGMAREAEALALAAQADLVLFLVDHDLTRAARQRLLELSRLGKRLMVVLNKKDRFTEEDRAAIRAKLRERLEGIIAPEDLVAVAADPSPVSVRVRKPDGGLEAVLEVEPPNLEELEDRVAAVLEREGEALRAGNLLLQARLREQAQRDRLARQRHDRAAAVIERHQWLAAVTALVNPVLVLGPMAAGAIQMRMLSEMAAVYDVPLSAEYIETVGRQMVQILFKLGIAEAAGSVLAGILKFNPLGFAAGGVVQAVTMAYLTRLTGDAFLEYLDSGQTWGEEGMQAVLTRRVEATRSSGWFLHFAQAVLGHLRRR